MALPPERITVKRRRDEEPVDALYIQPKKSRKTVIWNRVSSDPLESKQAQTLSSLSFHGHPQVPSVRTTRAEEDRVLPQEVRSTLPRNAVHMEIVQNFAGSDSSPESANFAPNVPNPSPKRPRKEPRKFHFTRRAVSSRNPAVLHSGIQKPKRKVTRDFACFVERTNLSKESELYGHKGPADFDEPSEINSDCHKGAAEPSTPRKRPLASSAEREWRKQTWKQPSKSDANTGSKPTGGQGKSAAMTLAENGSADLACQLQQFALEQIHSANEVVNTRKGSGPKVKPKPPRPRPAKRDIDMIDGECITTKPAADVLSDDAENFVFDVYVRQNEHADGNMSSGLPGMISEETDPDKVGLLVVEEEDQEIWDLYGEQDQSSEDDWNSEEEDENAEDHYRNDYPEDELDSDDEYDRDTYEHCGGGFDEDDLENEMHWSDDEIQQKKTWSHDRK
ncbi:MAG: hypothetical protein Q9218_000405 [Villophora microphyllina]